MFADDDAKNHPNEAIEVSQFLAGIPGIVVFDPEQGDIMVA